MDTKFTKQVCQSSGSQCVGLRLAALARPMSLLQMQICGPHLTY